MLGLRASFIMEHCDVEQATGTPGATLEPWQVDMLSDEGMFSITRKARQIGWSWCAAADAVAACFTDPGATCIFVSINMEEAGEKVRYAKAVYEALDGDYGRMPLTRESNSRLEWSNGSRVISHPCRPVRGKAKARIYLDEFAHYAKDRDIYLSALPATTRGGQVRIGSTPLGAQGVFWDLVTQRMQRYPGYRRRYVPWWASAGLCVNPAEAQKVAGTLPSEEMVRLFGTDRVKAIFANMVLEDFQQEYEASWVDETISFITWDEIKQAQELSAQGSLEMWAAHSVAEATGLIDTLRAQADRGRVEKVFYAGVDVGRRRDLTEVFLLGKTATGQLVLRLTISLAGTRFDEQEAILHKVMTTLGVPKMCIDETGMGMMLAERLHLRYGLRVEPCTFTNAKKEEWAVGLKVQMSKGSLLLPANRDLALQVHSVRKLVTPAKNITFDVARTEKHHADKFWALALAVHAAKQPVGVFLG